MNDNEAWAWANRHEVTKQIEKTLLNALHWEDIPLGPDGNGVYIADDHFDPVARDQPVELYEDPTPRLEGGVATATVRKNHDTPPRFCTADLQLKHMKQGFPVLANQK